jgi:hypothetical protein
VKRFCIAAGGVEIVGKMTQEERETLIDRRGNTSKERRILGRTRDSNK